MPVERWRLKTSRLSIGQTGKQGRVAGRTRQGRSDGDVTLTMWTWACGHARAAARTLLLCAGLAVGAGLSGCGVVPGDGPMMYGAQRDSTAALPYDVIELTATNVAPYRPIKFVDRSTGMGHVSFGGRVAVAPGDVLKVRIFEPYEGSIFPTLQRGGSDLGNQRVADDGTISVPFVGKVAVAGLDLTQIERRIVTQIGSKAQDPQVIVEFVADRTHTVMISGEVRTPGRVSLLEGIRSVGDAINRAGGPDTRNPASQLEVVVRRDGEVILVAQYSELLAGADIPVKRGDEIVLRPNIRAYTALGAVQKAGNYNITRSGLSLMEALGEVGGLSDERANRTGVFIFRMANPDVIPQAKSQIFRLDLGNPQSIFVAQQFGIQPQDVVYVTNAPLVEYNKIIVALYRTFSVVGVLRGSVVPSLAF
jgi:polysaccharide export outer membrane protein